MHLITDRIPEGDDIMKSRKRFFYFLIIHDIAAGASDFFFFVLGTEPNDFELIVAGGQARLIGAFVSLNVFF